MSERRDMLEPSDARTESPRYQSHTTSQLALLLVGAFLFLFALASLIYFAAAFNVGVDTAAGRVANLVRLEDRLIGVIVSSVVLVIAVLMMYAGRRQPALTICSECNATLPAGMASCPYCGAKTILSYEQVDSRNAGSIPASWEKTAPNTNIFGDPVEPTD